MKMTAMPVILLVFTNKSSPCLHGVGWAPAGFQAQPGSRILYIGRPRPARPAAGLYTVATMRKLILLTWLTAAVAALHAQAARPTAQPPSPATPARQGPLALPKLAPTVDQI